MKPSHLHAIRTGGACAALVAAVGLAFACSESPTGATLDDLAPQFDKKGSGTCSAGLAGGHCHDEDPPPPPPSAITAALTNPAGAGVFSDGEGSYDGDHVTARFRLTPQCAPDERHMFLQGISDITALTGVTIPTCNGEGVAGAGWLFIQLPDLLEADICDGAPSCTPFPDIPSFVIRGKKVKPTGAFAPTAHFFFFGIDENGDGDYYNFVFQQALVTIDGGSRTVTADKAHLYTLGDLQTILWGDDPDDAFSLNITVTP